MIFGDREWFFIGSFGVKTLDIVMFVGMLPMYYEMIRMAIRLFNRLKEADGK